MKTITIDNVEYKLVPIKKQEEYDEFTTYKECITDCSTFAFSILLDRDDDSWGNTECITYKKGEEDEDYWDNSQMIQGWLRREPEYETMLDKDLSDEEVKLLCKLRDKVNSLGWVK